MDRHSILQTVGWNSKKCIIIYSIEQVWLRKWPASVYPGHFSNLLVDCSFTWSLKMKEAKSWEFIQLKKDSGIGFCF